MADRFEPIPILACQQGWLAVDKPAGLSVHNDPGRDLIWVVEDRILSDPLLTRRLCVLPPFRVQPVHRLDKETSGVILLAADKNAVKNLSDGFVAGDVKKTYHALVHGRFEETPTPMDTLQIWDVPLSKTAGGRNNPIGTGKRVPCRTGFRILEQSIHYALLEIELFTGRKHQIRRHAKISGHPVVGDTRYGSTRSIRFLKEHLSFDRLGLHCRQVEFTPKGQHTPVCITSEDPLIDMVQLLKNDQNGA